MVLSNHINGREFDKFINLLGSTSVRVGAVELGTIVALGGFPGSFGLTRFGHNNDIDTANDEDIWDGGGTYVFPSVAQTMSVVSDNINDTLLGTGATRATINGLNANFDQISETIDLDGTTPVNTVNSYIRIEFCTVTAGASERNEGTITFTGNTDPFIFAQIDPGNNITFMAIYTVPAEHTVLLNRMFMTLGPKKLASGAKNGNITFSIRDPNAENIFIPFGDLNLSSTGSSFGDVAFPQPIIIPEKSDLKFRVSVNQNNVRSSAGFDMLLLNNELISP